MNDFSSIEALVEFGLGATVAQQMVNTMNTTISTMKVPGVDNPLNDNLTAYFVVVDNQQCGPIDNEEVKTLIQSQKITKETLMWTKGMAAWKPAVELASVNALFMLYPPLIK